MTAVLHQAQTPQRQDHTNGIAKAALLPMTKTWAPTAADWTLTFPQWNTTQQ
jgi:hypothetical protein